MSEWMECEKCGMTHENQTACPEAMVGMSEEERGQTDAFPESGATAARLGGAVGSEGHGVEPVERPEGGECSACGKVHPGMGCGPERGVKRKCEHCEREPLEGKKLCGDCFVKEYKTGLEIGGEQVERAALCLTVGAWWTVITDGKVAGVLRRGRDGVVRYEVVPEVSEHAKKFLAAAKTVAAVGAAQKDEASQDWWVAPKAGICMRCKKEECSDGCELCPVCENDSIHRNNDEKCFLCEREGTHFSQMTRADYCGLHALAINRQFGFGLIIRNLLRNQKVDEPQPEQPVANQPFEPKMDPATSELGGKIFHKPGYNPVKVPFVFSCVRCGSRTTNPGLICDGCKRAESWTVRRDLTDAESREIARRARVGRCIACGGFDMPQPTSLRCADCAKTKQGFRFGNEWVIPDEPEQSFAECSFEIASAPPTLCGEPADLAVTTADGTHKKERFFCARHGETILRRGNFAVEFRRFVRENAKAPDQTKPAKEEKKFIGQLVISDGCIEFKPACEQDTAAIAKEMAAAQKQMASQQPCWICPKCGMNHDRKRVCPKPGEGWPGWIAWP